MQELVTQMLIPPPKQNPKKGQHPLPFDIVCFVFVPVPHLLVNVLNPPPTQDQQSGIAGGPAPAPTPPPSPMPIPDTPYVWVPIASSSSPADLPPNSYVSGQQPQGPTYVCMADLPGVETHMVGSVSYASKPAACRIARGGKRLNGVPCCYFC